MNQLSDIAGAISDMWQLRLSGDIVSASDQFARIAVMVDLNLRMPVVDAVPTLTGRGLSVEQACEILAFIPAALRFNKKNDESDRVMEALLAVAAAANQPNQYQLSFQAGLNSLNGGRYGEGLKFFQISRCLARSDIEAVTSLFNAILCLESMGYDFSRQKAELMDLRAKMAPTRAGMDPVEAAIRNQITAMDLRRAFSAGDLAGIGALCEEVAAWPRHGGSSGGSGSVSGSDQATYYAAWLQSLPHVDTGGEGAVTLADLVAARPGSFLAEFRMRTLSGALSRDDYATGIRTGDKIERLYLWVWRWLLTGDKKLLERAVTWASHLAEDLGATGAQICREDFGLLECAMRWLALFSGVSDSSVDRFLGRLSAPASRKSTLLEFEALLLSHAFSLRDGDLIVANDELERLIAHDARTLSGFYLTRYPGISHDEAPLATSSIMNVLFDAISGIAAVDNFSSFAPGIYVDVLGRRLINVGGSGGCAVHDSSIAAALLTMIGGRAQVPVLEILNECFGIKSHDPVIHDPKLAQAICQVNKMVAPFIVIRRKRDVIAVDHVAGVRGSLRFFRGGVLSQQAMPCADRLLGSMIGSTGDGGLPQAAPKAPTSKESQPGLAAGRWLTRGELEKLLNMSRATACRRVSEWIGKGLMEKRGGGRNVEYRPGPALIATISEIQ